MFNGFFWLLARANRNFRSLAFLVPYRVGYIFFLTMEAVPLEPNAFRNTRHSP